MPGNIFKTTVLPLKIVNLILLAPVLHQHAQQNALMVHPLRNTNANQELLLRELTLLKFNRKFTPMDLWKLLSMFIKISSVTRVVFTNTLMVVLLVVMPLNSSVGDKKVELTTGFVLTHGTQAGENKDSSELPSDNAELMLAPMLANLKFLLRKQNEIP